MIVIAGDLHGSPESLDLIVSSLNLADGRKNWTARNTVFILTGDACDRGHDSASIYRLIMKWQNEAPSLKSEVIFLIGNHEVMNISGELYYNTPEETASYSRFGNGRAEKKKAFSEGGWLFEWLLRQPFIVHRGPFIVAHADFPSVYRNLTVEEINQQSKFHFSGAAEGRSEVDPLLWNREAREFSPEYEAALREFLSMNDAGCWVCGHTPSFDGRFRSRADNRYICVDTAMSLGIRNTSALVYEDSVLSARYFSDGGPERVETLTL